MGKANVHPTGEYEGVYYVDFENLLSYTKKDDETERKTLKNISPWEMSDYEFDDVESQMNLENYRATLVDALKKRFPRLMEAMTESSITSVKKNRKLMTCFMVVHGY